MKKLKIILHSMIQENPTFSLFLGMCPVLIVSDSLFRAFGMGLCVFFVLLLSNIAISLIKKIVPNEIRVPVYIIIIATIVTIVDMCVHAFIPAIYSEIGKYINMIVVNCIILGRAESFASKNSVVDSIMDAIGISCGFLLAVLSLALFREFLGTGGLCIKSLMGNTLFEFQLIPDEYCLKIFNSQPGAFLTLGIAVAILNVIKVAIANKKKAKEQEAKAKLALAQESEVK